MMMKAGLIMDENMSNLTSASGGGGEASASSSGTRNEIGSNSNMYPILHSSFASTNHQLPPPPKKRRSLPGNPDPGAEVIALSPKALMTKNRFICEICNKGFQRDQNLQLHRRGHNLPWKLKQRNNKEVIRKKVYVCPEATCVHHDPSRALGDLTGIKKHFFRKHGEKKWKCEKCSKRYAVQSDWKAHSKICGTREYRCDCGTLFSRRDSFITHRAFCDALAEEMTARSTATNPTSFSSQTAAASSSSSTAHMMMINLQSHLKREEDHRHHHHHLQSHLNNNIPPPWLPFPPVVDQNPNPNPNTKPSLTLPPLQSLLASSSSPHMSATALLQKASQMGVTMSRQLQQQEEFVAASTTAAAAATTSSIDVHDIMMMSSFEGSSPSTFEEAFMMLNPKRDETISGGGRGGGRGGNNNDGLTRDFLGLRAFSSKDFLNIPGLQHMNSSSSSSSFGHHYLNQAPWHG